MKREIKFRAWDKEYEIVIYPKAHYVQHGDVASPKEKVEAWERYNFGEVYNPEENEYHVMYAGDERFVPMQYTGLKDKNGVEIYEGDILMRQHDRRTITVASLKDGRYSAFWDFSDFLDPADDYFGCEVIGNIYENSELLK